SKDDMHWMLIEASQRILPEVGRDLGAYAAEQLIHRGLDIRLGTRLESCVDGVVKLSDGDSYPADTIVWTAGVKAHPVLNQTDLPRDEKGRVTCAPTLQIVDAAGDVVEGAWTADVPGTMCSPSAQHAVRQAKVLADNIAAVIKQRPVHDYRHKYAGSVASLGLHKGVAQVYGIKLKGFPAWFMHRSYHVSRIPSWNRRVRVVIDWTLALFLKREVVSLGELHQPRVPFTDVTPAVSADR